MNSIPLSLLCQECVLQHMEANLRFQLSRRCPSIRKLEKSVPLQIQFLNLDEYTFTVNDTSYHLSIHQDYSNCKTIPFDIKMDNAGGGIQEDIDIYGGRIKPEITNLSPGDIRLESRFVGNADDVGENDDGAKEEALKRRLEELEQELARRKKDGIYVEHSVVDAQVMVDMLSRDGSDQDEVVEDSLFSLGDGKSEETVPNSVDLEQQIEQDDEVVQDSYDESDESVVEDSLFEDATQIDQNSENLDSGPETPKNVGDSLFKDSEPQNSEKSDLSPLFSDSKPSTPIDLPPEMSDETLPQEIESVKLQLLAYQLKRENGTPPWKHFLQLKISNSDGVVDVKRGNYNKKLAEVMKMIFDTLFGGRKSPISVYRLYLPGSLQNSRVLRFPVGLKLKISHFHCQTDTDLILRGIETIIDASSLPLNQVECQDFPLHPIATSVRTLTISCLDQNSATTGYFLNLESKEFCLKYSDDNFHASDCIPIIQNWLETGKEVGTCFQFAMEREEMEVLMGIKNRFNGEKIGDRSIKIPMFGSKLLVSYEDGYADGNHDIMFKMEVVLS